MTIRGMTKRWLMADGPAGEGMSGGLVERLLAARGLADPETAKRFCQPKLLDLHDPGLMAGIDKAVERLIRAVRDREPIVIYGDYDVDGITATAILYHTLKTARPDADVRTYVPHRIEEGYGLNAEALRQIAASGARVVITVDCGISAIEPAKVAREAGLDLIITDHHPPTAPTSPTAPASPTASHDDRAAATLPECYAIVHPLVAGETGRYPFGQLSGAGVAFKVAWRFATTWCGSARVSAAFQQTLLHMLPLAALGTIADVVPLVGENRVLAAQGLAVIKRTPLVGLRALIEASDLMDEKIDSERVGFVLGPRLNACGRLGHAAEAVELLITKDEERAWAIAQRLAGLNKERQTTERKIFEQAARMAEDRGMTGSDHPLIVLAHADWHAGVVGIVCSRLVEAFARPTVLMQDAGGMCKGSARSIEGYSIHGGLASVAHHLTTWGGHDHAAGLSLISEKIDVFRDDLLRHARSMLTAEHLVGTVRIDCDALLGEMDQEAVTQLQRLAPFGKDNPTPVLRLQGLTLSEPPRQIGGHGKHLSLNLRQETDGTRRFVRGVWWNAGHLAGDLASGMCLDAVVEPRLNTWNGRISVEVEIKDIAVIQRQGSRELAPAYIRSAR